MKSQEIQTTVQENKINNYEIANECLNQLQFLLNRIGIVEFSISESTRHIKWQSGRVMNNDLLNKFCTDINELYRQAQQANMELAN